MFNVCHKGCTIHGVFFIKIMQPSHPINNAVELKAVIFISENGYSLNLSVDFVYPFWPNGCLPIYLIYFQPILNLPSECNRQYPA